MDAHECSHEEYLGLYDRFHTSAPGTGPLSNKNILPFKKRDRMEDSEDSAEFDPSMLLSSTLMKVEVNMEEQDDVIGHNNDVIKGSNNNVSTIKKTI